MHAAVYYGNHKLEIEEVPEPHPGEGQVKVQVSRNGICGTDLHEYYDGPIFIPPHQPHPLTGKAMPLIIGPKSAAASSRSKKVTASRSNPSTGAATAGRVSAASTTCATRWAFTG
jgi:hypothetical protein